MSTLYVLELEDDKWYVGKTDDVQRRFKQHKDGGGATWTREYRPIKICNTTPNDSPHAEDNLTKDYMKKYGVNNVRGGSYTSFDLPAGAREILEMEMTSRSDKCYKCGMGGHFASKCPVTVRSKSPKAGCSTCGRDSHKADKCYAKTHVDGTPLEEEVWQCEFCDEEFETERDARKCGCRNAKINRFVEKTTLRGLQVICFRCGRPNHLSTDCYASTHKKGYDL